MNTAEALIIAVARLEDALKNNGVSLRDYFAGKAMQGICCNRSHTELKGHAKASAKVAYLIADAMLEARND